MIINYISSTMTVTKLVACLLNISEGRNRQIVEAVASAATLKGENVPVDPSRDFSIPSTILNIFSDYDYNRSVITIAAPSNHIGKSVIAACTVATEQIDMRQQQGIHPRLGAVDLIPIYPLSPAVSLLECGNIAKDIANKLSERVAMTSFLFGAAQKDSRTLVQRRKDIGWFHGQSHTDYSVLQYDVGNKPSAMLGLAGVGASYYVMNCNVTIKTQDMKIGSRIAKAIRGATQGGLPGVQAMAFPHTGNIEVACNVECYRTNVKEGDAVGTFVGVGEEWQYTSPQTIERRVVELANRENIELVGTALVGFTPDEAYRLAAESLTRGNREWWKSHNPEHM